MDRIQTIRESLATFHYNWMKKKIKECEAQPCSFMLREAEKVLLRVKEEQDQGDNRSLGFVALFHFRSSLWTGSYRYQIGVFDETLYLSNPLAAANFIPEQLYKDTEELKQAVEAELKRKFVRLNSFEIQSAVRTILQDYQQLTEVYWSQAAKVLVDSETFRCIDKGENWKIVSGTYMEQLNIILQSENRRCKYE